MNFYLTFLYTQGTRNLSPPAAVHKKVIHYGAKESVHRFSTHKSWNGEREEGHGFEHQLIPQYAMRGKANGKVDQFAICSN